MLPDTIIEEIKKKAENRAKEYEVNSWEWILLSEAYKDGQVDAIEFFIWARKNGFYLATYLTDEPNFDCPAEHRYYSFEQLLSRYLNSLTDKAKEGK